MGYRTIGRFVYDSSTVAAVDAGGSVPFPTATATCNVTGDGTTVTITQAGVFEVGVNLTLVATSTDTVEAQLYRNGTAVPGAHAYATPAASGDYVPLSFSTVITIPRCNQAVLSVGCATATSVTVSNLVIVKLA